MTVPYMTPGRARSCSLDAGNASMRKAGRTEWNYEDWNAAAERFAECVQLIAAATDKPLHLSAT